MLHDKHILVITDIVGYGNAAFSVMRPVLSHFGLSVCCLPTAVVSNTLNYGTFEILDTTDYMRGARKAWDDLGFQFDAVLTGFLTSAAQAELVREICEEYTGRGAKVFCDPIMADVGRLYNGKTERDVENMRRIASAADYVMPNYTEAALLAGVPYTDEPTKSTLRTTIDSIRALGARSVIITSVRTDGADQIAGYDAETGEYFSVPFEQIPVRFPGTGDIFSAILTGSVLSGESLGHACRKAAGAIHAMIEREQPYQDHHRGIRVETCLDLI